VIGEESHGKAYGAVVGIYNLFMLVVPLIVGFLRRYPRIVGLFNSLVKLETT